MGYIAYPVDLSPDVLAQAVVDRLKALEPGWEPTPGGFDWLLIESVATIHSELAGLVTDVRTALFRHAGLAIFNVAPIDGAPASVVTTWTAQDAAGYTIPAGTQVSYRVAGGGDLVVFATTTAAVIPPGSTQAAGVVVTATTAGAAGNGLTGPVLLDSTLPWVTAITQAASTSGGEDPETDDEYLARLPSEIEVQRTPVRERDFQAVALRVPGVGRAVALDGWNTVSDTLANEKTVGIVVCTADGQACSPAVKAAAKAAVEAVREVNFVVGVADPVRTNVTVVYAATCYPGFVPAEVEARADAAIVAFLDPSGWGVPRFAVDATNAPWVAESVVRVNDLVAVIDAVEGIRAVTSVQVEGGGDFTLPGRVGLPVPQAPVGTVTAS